MTESELDLLRLDTLCDLVEGGAEESFGPDDAKAVRRLLAPAARSSGEAAPADFTEAEADAIIALAAKTPVSEETKRRLTDRVLAKWDAEADVEGELAEVSRLLVEFDGETTHTTVSAHLADLFNRLRASPSGSPTAPFIAEYELATISNFESVLRDSLGEEQATVKLDDLDTIVSLLNRLRSGSPTAGGEDEEDTLTVEKLRAMDGESVLDLFCNRFGWPSAVIEDDEDCEDEDGYVIRLGRDEFDAGVEAYLCQPASLSSGSPASPLSEDALRRAFLAGVEDAVGPEGCGAEYDEPSRAYAELIAAHLGSVAPLSDENQRLFARVFEDYQSSIASLDSLSSPALAGIRAQRIATLAALRAFVGRTGKQNLQVARRASDELSSQ